MASRKKQNHNISISLIFWSLVFTYVNFSEASWNFFNQLGGTVWAKIGPEITGIVFYLLIALVLLEKSKVSFNLRQFRGHLFPVTAIFILTFITRLQEFNLYFFKEDIFNYLTRNNVLYNFGPWVSSHPALVTELIRYFSGYNPFLYQVVLLISHAVFSISVYILAMYFSKNKTAAFLSGSFFSMTTLHFEEFNWLIHPINYGWQALIMSLSVVALAWQIKKDPKDTPLISAFLMMAAVGSGMAKTAPFFLVLGTIDVIITFPRFAFGKVASWLKWFAKRQFVVWALMFTFLLTRWLLTAGGATRSEVITAPYYKIFFWLLGSYTLPPELMRFLVDNFGKDLPESIITTTGSTPGLIGAIFFILFIISFAISWYRKKKLPLIVEVGLAWLLVNTIFNTYYSPHIPVSLERLISEVGPPHIAYPPVVGTSLLYGYLFWQMLVKSQEHLQKLINVRTAIFVSRLILLVIFLIMLSSLRDFYTKWLNMAKGTQVTNPQFFFEAHMRFIPKDALLVNIFYDDYAKKRVDNYKPPREYFEGFWNNAGTKTIYGEQDLNDAIKEWQQEGTLKENIDNLYYIYTNYPRGVAQDLSLELRSQILGRKKDIDNWKVFWGEGKDGWFMPSLSRSEKSKIPFYLPVTVVSEKFQYPAMLSPRVDMKIEILPMQSSFKPDIRPDIISGLLVRGSLIEKGDLDNAAEYTINHPEDNRSLAFAKTLRVDSVANKILNPGEVVEGEGNWFLVVGFSGENADFKPVGEKESIHDIFNEYDAVEWGLAYIPDGTISKSFSFQLPPSGRFFHRLLILPLSKDPLAIKISDTIMSNPNLYLR